MIEHFFSFSLEYTELHVIVSGFGKGSITTHTHTPCFQNNIFVPHWPKDHLSKQSRHTIRFTIESIKPLSALLPFYVRSKASEYSVN